MSNNVIIVGKQRKPWVDFLRALAIFLVVYGHQIQPCTPYFVLTSPIKMPLFFAISGYLFTLKPGKEYIKKVVMTLIVPWFLLSLLPVILLIPVRGFSGFLLSVGKVLSGEVAWFMPCFILSSLMFYGIMKVKGVAIKKDLSDKWGGVTAWFIVVCFAGIGMWLYNKGWMNYAMFNRALTVLPFFMIGYTFKRYEQKLIELSPRQFVQVILLLILIYAVSILLGIKLYPGESIDVHMVSYFSVPLCALQILSGVLLMFTVFSRIDNYPKWILTVGKDSLIIYMWHPYIIAILLRLMAKTGISLHYMLTGLIVTVAGIFLCCLLTTLIRRFAPFMIGNR